jgi:hypothetical protein
MKLPWKQVGMSHRLASLTLALFSITGLPAVSFAGGDSADQQQQRDRKSPESKKTDGGSLTGCVDEQEGGRYVLIDERNLTPIANLEAEGFPNEGFAKHLGQKVTVRGTINSSGARPVFKVRSIETISSACGNKQQL